MIRKFNYTGRQKIFIKDIDIKLLGKEESLSFNASLDLQDYELPSYAKIYIEPYFRQSFLRFECGSVGNFSIPDETFLREIPSKDNIYFRIKIVDERGKRGLLLAFAESIKPSSREDGEDFSKNSILPVNFSTPIGRQVWKLGMEDESPILFINPAISEGRELVTSDSFISLVYPEVIRTIFKEICINYSEYDSSGDHWASSWLRFSEKILLADEKPKGNYQDKPDEMEDFIENVVDKFCKQHRILAHYENSSLS